MSGHCLSGWFADHAGVATCLDRVKACLNSLDPGSDDSVRNWRLRLVISGQRVQLCARPLRERSVWNGRRNSDLLDQSFRSGKCRDRRPKHPQKQIPAYAKTISNRVSVHEAAEQPDLLDFVAAITGDVSAAAVLLASIEFAISTTTGVTKPSQVRTLRTNLKKNEKVGSAKNDLNELAAQFMSALSGNALVAFIIHLTSGGSSATYRPGLLQALLAALRILGSEPLTALPDAARKTIDARRRIAPTSTARCSVGSTLLVKGLEYDYVTLVDPARVPSAKHLYVALSRARHKITLALPPDSQLGKWFI